MLEYVTGRRSFQVAVIAYPLRDMRWASFGEPQPLDHSRSAEALTEAKGYSLSLLPVSYTHLTLPTKA